MLYSLLAIWECSVTVMVSASGGACRFLLPLVPLVPCIRVARRRLRCCSASRYIVPPLARSRGDERVGLLSVKRTLLGRFTVDVFVVGAVARLPSLFK